MLGTYFEFLIQNDAGISCTEDGIDWIIADDAPGIAELIGRDLENPEITTWQEAMLLELYRPPINWTKIKT